MCLSAMQEDGTSHSWNLASDDKRPSVTFDRLVVLQSTDFCINF